MPSPLNVPKLLDFLDEIDRTKTAAAKKKAESADPGTSHPTGSAPDNTQAAKEGPRSSENSADVKDQTGSAAVDATSPGMPDQDSRQMDVTVTSKATGEDPANETDAVGSSVSDPGTSHPATTEDGQKYAAWTRDQLTKRAGALADEIMATMTVTAARQTKVAAPRPNPTPAPAVPAPAADPAPADDYYKLAAEDAILAGQMDARRVGEYLRAYRDGQKRAADESDSSGGETKEEKPEPKGEGGEGGGGGGGEGGGSGGEGGGGGPPPDAGGGGAPDQAGQMEQIVQALLEAGLTPDDLMQLVQQLPTGGAGAGGPPPGDPGMGGPPPGGPPMPPPGGDPMAGGPPPGGPPMPPPGGPMEVTAAHKRELVKLAADVARHTHVAHKGRPTWKAPKTAQEQRFREDVKGALSDLLGRPTK